MPERLRRNGNVQPRQASPWACGVAALLVAGLGIHLSVLITETASAPPVPATIALSLPPSVVATPPPALPQPPVPTPAPSPAPPAAVTAPVPAPTGEAAVAEGPIVEAAGPEWTRKPLPLPSPSLLRRMAAAPPGTVGATGALGVPALGRSSVSLARAEAPSAPRGAGTAESGGLGAAAPGSATVGIGKVAATGNGKAAPAVATPSASVSVPPATTGAVVTAEAPLRITLATNRGGEGRYRRGEWVVLRLAASAACYATLFRVGASGEVKQALPPEEKPAGSYSVAIKAGEFGAGEEWVVAIASAQPLPDAQVIALLRARPESMPDGPALNAVMAHLTGGAEAEATPAPEAWGYAMLVARYEVMDALPAAGTKPSAANRGSQGDPMPGQ